MLAWVLWPSGRGNGGVRGHGHLPRCHSWKLWKLTKAPPRWVPGTAPPGVLGSGSDSASPSAPPPQSSPTPGSRGLPQWLAPHPSPAGPSRTGSFRWMTSSWPSSRRLLTLECSELWKGDATCFSVSREPVCPPLAQKPSAPPSTSKASGHSVTCPCYWDLSELVSPSPTVLTLLSASHFIPACCPLIGLREAF